MLNATNDYRYMYEPFNREQVPAMRSFGLRQYVRPADTDVPLLQVVSSVFEGRIRSAWVDQYNHKMIARRRLIKDVRSNLMVKWIRENFPRLRIIFVIRHPCAVALSKVRLGWRINLKEAFLSQTHLVADHLLPFVNLLEGANSEFEQHLIAWCVENLVPLRQLERHDMHLVFYEDLVESPRESLVGMCSYIEQPFDTAMLTVFNRHSASTPKRARTNSHREQTAIGTWRAHLSPGDLAYADRVTRAFGLNNLYDDSGRPRPANALRYEGVFPSTFTV
jgi:hypothetical protein